MSDFEDINTVPVSSDLMSSNSIQLSANIIDRPYPDLHTYIDTHFRLLYEDVMQPFKKGLHSLLRNCAPGKRNAEVRLYENVRFVRGGLIFDEHSIPDCASAWQYRQIRFKPPPKVNWETSKRLIQGSFVCLWDGKNEFITGITTFSFSRSLASGKVTLALATQDFSDNFLDKTYVMIESMVFFEPYRAVLEALRSFTPQTFPLKDYVLGHVTNARPPAYLEKSTASYFVWNSTDKQNFQVKRPLEFASWPSPEQLGLDEKQHSSLITALTSQVSLVQGPPGTGKTFLALQIVKALLDNASLWHNDYSSSSTLDRNRLFPIEKPIRRPFEWYDYWDPILVVCLTNHALDQFLEGILKWTRKIIRVGGQSKSAVMKGYSLSAAKKELRELPRREYHSTRYASYARKMKQLRECMASEVRELNTELFMLTKEFPTFQDLVGRRVIDQNAKEFFETEQSKLETMARRRKQNKTNISDPLKRWLGWENHGLLKRVARELKLDLNKLQRKRTTKEKEKIEMLTGDGDRDFSDGDEVSNVIEDATDDDLDSERDSTLITRFNYQKMATPSKMEENKIETQWVEDGVLHHFREVQLNQLEDIRQFLCNLPLIDANVCYEADEMNELPVKVRWQLFASWRRRFRDVLRESVKVHEHSYVRDVVEYKEKRGKSLAALCRGAAVVGMTTTGAAKNRKLLEALRCKIVVVEEAAEVLESHIICSLTEDCQQLIMIGDHQQLRPSVNVYELEQKYNLDVSLFERWINVGVEPNVLNVQHRMRPEIARLITPAIYKDLKNAPSVHSRPPVTALLHDVFFYHHTNQEAKNENSYYNLHEVDMALRLADYLVFQGVPQKHITILSTYAAQMHKLRNKRNSFKSLENVLITVVDNYQGQENEIIILSLVRNNTRSSIGFLATANRICVALSRARCGFYMLGNMDLLSACSSLWSQLKKILSENNQIGPAFPLTCTRHKETVKMAAKPMGFPTTPFCTAKCAFEMSCGHMCPMPCHEEKVPHADPCTQLVSETLPCGHELTFECVRRKQVACKVAVETANPCGHLRTVPCHLRDNAPCPELVLKQLPCGHEIESSCSISIEKLKCAVDVSIELKCSHTKLVSCEALTQNADFEWETLCKESVSKELLCGHTKRMECRVDPSSVDCGNFVDKIAECGHLVRYQCHGSSPDDLEAFPCDELIKLALPCDHYQQGPCHSTPGPCQEKVARILDCGHEVQAKCFERSSRCEVKVIKQLKCEHTKLVPCYLDVDGVKCDEIAYEQRPSCSHLVPVTCKLRHDAAHLNSIECSTTIQKRLLCGHDATVQCSSRNEDVTCTVLVNKSLTCGHYKQILCKEDSENVICSELVYVDLSCGHPKKMPCRKDPATETCAEIVSVTLDCGHSSAIICGSRKSAKCTVTTPAHLTCGHEYQIPCGSCADDINCDTLVMKTFMNCGHVESVPCFQLDTRHDCNAVILKKLSCGHVENMPCHKDTAKQPCFKCKKKKTINEENLLPCGHETKAKVAGDDVTCNEMCKKRLGCGHTVNVLCSTPLEELVKMLCGNKLSRKLPCGHQVEIACGSFDAEKPLNELYCSKLVQKKIAECGHQVESECSKKVTKIDCQRKCKRRLECGHQCKLPCSEDCSSMSCEVMIDLPKSSRLACGHATKFPCKLRNAEPSELEFWAEQSADCAAVCGEELDCGHRCTGRCSDCVSSYSHAVCKARCTRILVCGHRCDALCYIACPPCNKPCAYECVHGPCNKKCCEDCSPCEKPCAWRCLHRKCKHMCSEPCNREPCNEPCPNKLDCGHNCVGLCGERCPPKCPSCLGSTISINKNKRYFYFECGHWVELKHMDNWIFNREDNEGESIRSKCFRLPCCPVCEKPVLKCFRYGDVIKDCYFDLPSFKFEYVRDAPAYNNSIIKSFRLFLGNNQLASVHDPLKQFISEVEQLQHTKRINRDEMWDAVNRSSVMYEWLCLLSDTTRKYSCVIGNKRYTIQLEDAGQFFEIGLQVLKKIVENRTCGSEFCSSLSDLFSRLDYLRQFRLVQTASDKYEIFSGRELEQAIALSENWLEIDEDGSKFLDSLLGSITQDSKLNLETSVLRDKEFSHRLSMYQHAWRKCLNRNCGAVFSSVRFDECPSC